MSLPSKKEPPVLFKLLEDFLIAEKIIHSFEKTKPSEKFENSVRTAYLQVNNMLDIELDKICDQAPPIDNNDSGTNEATAYRV